MRGIYCAGYRFIRLALHMADLHARTELEPAVAVSTAATHTSVICAYQLMYIFCMMSVVGILVR